ncbi:hypothetical protein [Natrialba sp. PRR66]|uniref:hypothetical protein n=1 Tax=Natrialba sp. PRR66 TaxID=3098146 RepID=UPI002B1E51C0|nr:hypothetical protein [Natrialba sp. PRR66]
MSNPFDDLKTDDESESPSESGDTDDSASKTETDSVAVDGESSAPETSSVKTSNEQTTDPSEQSVSDETPPASASPAETGPAFEYSEVQQKPFYARTKTVNEFENKIRTTIVPKLAEAGVLDEENREIHDAALRLANERPERIAELILEERRQNDSH